ncbi:MAG: CdaR family protein [Candidatus Adiutrix sp.]
MVKAREIRNHILFILVSLGLSFFLWLSLSGQNTSTEEIIVPVALINLPTEMLITSEIPPSVTIQVQANPAQVRFLSDRKPNLLVNVASTQEGHNAFPVLNEHFDLPRGVQVRRSYPAVIEFDAVQLHSKTVPVKAVITGTPAAGYLVKSIEAEPLEVLVQAAMAELDKVESAATAPIDISGRTQAFNTTAILSMPSLGPRFIFTPGEARVYINIEERRVSRTFENVPITINSADPTALVSAFKITPQTVKVAIDWPISSPANPLAADIQAHVNIRPRGTTSDSAQIIEVPIIVSSPPSTTVISISPVMATVTVPPLGPLP